MLVWLLYICLSPTYALLVFQMDCLWQLIVLVTLHRFPFLLPLQDTQHKYQDVNMSVTGDYHAENSEKVHAREEMNLLIDLLVLP